MKTSFQSAAFALTLAWSSVADANVAPGITAPANRADAPLPLTVGSMCYDYLQGTLYIFDIGTGGNIARAITANNNQAPPSLLAAFRHVHFCESDEYKKIDAGYFFEKVPSADLAGWAPVQIKAPAPPAPK